MAYKSLKELQTDVEEIQAKIKQLEDLGVFVNYSSLEKNIEVINNIINGSEFVTAFSNQVNSDPSVQYAFKQLIDSLNNITPTIYSPALINVVESVLSAYINWNKIDTAVGYYLYYKIQNGEYKRIGPIKNNYITLSGLSAGTTYTITIRSYKGAEISPKGVEFSFTTKTID